MIQVNRSRFNSTARRKQFAAHVKEKWTHRSCQHSLVVERQHAVGDRRKGCVLLIPIRGLQEENEKKVNSWTHQTTTHGNASALGVWAWAAAFTPVIWTRLESKAWRHPNAPSVCCTSRPQLYVSGSRWCKVESNLNQAWIKCLMSLSLQTYHLPAAFSDHSSDCQAADGTQYVSCAQPYFRDKLNAVRIHLRMSKLLTHHPTLSLKFLLVLFSLIADGMICSYFPSVKWTLYELSAGFRLLTHSICGAKFLNDHQCSLQDYSWKEIVPTVGNSLAIKWFIFFFSRAFYLWFFFRKQNKKKKVRGYQMCAHSKFKLFKRSSFQIP